MHMDASVQHLAWHQRLILYFIAVVTTTQAPVGAVTVGRKNLWPLGSSSKSYFKTQTLWYTDTQVIWKMYIKNRSAEANGSKSSEYFVKHLVKKAAFINWFIYVMLCPYCPMATSKAKLLEFLLAETKSVGHYLQHIPKQRPNSWKPNKSTMTKHMHFLSGCCCFEPHPPKRLNLNDPTDKFSPKSVTFAAGFGKDKWPWVVVNHRECHELLLPWRSTCNDVWFGCLREVDFWKMNGWNLTLPETNHSPWI